MVGTSPKVTLMVLIYLAHSVVGERILLVVLLIPYAALPYQSVGTTQPPVAILRLEDGMQAVQSMEVRITRISVLKCASHHALYM